MAHFTHEHLKKSHLGKGKYCRVMGPADLRAIADAWEKGQIDLITRRISTPDQIASDDSGRTATLGFLEWANN